MFEQILNRTYVSYVVYSVTTIKKKYGFRVKLVFSDGYEAIKQHSGFKLKAEANEERNKVIGQLENHTYVVYDRIKANDFFECWLNKIMKPKITYNSFMSYRNIIQNLDRNHYKPIIIKFMQDDINRSITDKFLELDVDIYEMNLSFWSLELRTYTVAKKLDLLLLEIAPDVIHTHGYHPVLVASLLKYRVPKVETLHCISKEDYPLSKGFFVGNWMNLRYLKSLQSIDYCAAISKTVCEFYNNKLWRRYKRSKERDYLCF